MDQAEPEDQNIPGHQPECRSVSNLGGYVLLPAFGVYQVPNKVQTITLLPAQTHSGCPVLAPDHHRPAYGITTTA